MFHNTLNGCFLYTSIYNKLKQPHSRKESMTNHLNIFIFALILVLVTFWLQLQLFLTTSRKSHTKIQAIQNSDLLNFIHHKTGFKLEKIYLVPSIKLYGLMSGIFKPHLILSTSLHKEFNSDETEYVLLHEMGHYLLHHNQIEVITGLILLTSGSTLISITELSTLLSIMLGFLCGIIMIRLGRIHEYQADQFSLTRMNNPEGMITATQKFQNQNLKSRHPLIETLFYRGNPISNRIRMANAEISRRQTLKTN